MEEAITTLAHTRDFPSARKLIEAHPAIVSAHADRIIEVLVGDHHDLSDAAKMLQTWRMVFTRVRQVGLETAFDEKAELDQLVYRIEQMTARSQMRQRVELCRKALALTSRTLLPGQWASLRGNMGTSLLAGPDGDKARSIEEAIACFSDIESVYTKESFPLEWANTQRNLAMAYSHRVAGNSRENVERARNCVNLALEIFTRESLPAEWARAQMDLGVVFSCMFHEPAKNLERAIDCYRAALGVLRPGEQEWFRATHSLGVLYAQRIRGESADNIEAAIEHYQRAVDVARIPESSVEFARHLERLGSAHVARLVGNPAENVERAIDCYRRALKILRQEDEPEEWARTQTSLGNAYLRRLIGRADENVESALTHFGLALEIYTLDAYPDRWGLVQQNLGAAFVLRDYSEGIENARKAIGHCTSALNFYTREAFAVQWAMIQHTLGNAFRRLGDRDAAVAYFHQALEVFSDVSPREAARTLRSVGDLHFAYQEWLKAYEAYDRAAELGEDSLAMAYTESGRRAESGNASAAHTQAAYCLLRIGRRTDSLLRLERGKARLLTEALAMNDIHGPALPERLRASLREARERVRELESELCQDGKVIDLEQKERRRVSLQHAREELRDVVESIGREHPKFLPRALDFASVAESVPEGGALVAFVTTSQGCAAFVVPAGTESIRDENVVFIDRFDLIRDLLAGSESSASWVQAYFSWRSGGLFREWLATLDARTAQLWPALMGPVHERLRALQLVEGAPIVIVAGGLFGLLPLHAAWRQVGEARRAFVDDYTVSYVPSISALRSSLQKLREPRRQAQRFLAIVDPTGDLPYARIEGRAVAALFGTDARILVGHGCKPEAVVDGARGCNYLHFACHGDYGLREVLSSALMLAGGARFSLADVISRLDLECMRLVVLSACETGLMEPVRWVDEYVALPSGFLQAGAPGVVASLWPVDDVATSLLMQQLYRRHLQDGLPLNTALRDAQRWLRDSTTRELLARYQSFPASELGSGEGGEDALLGASTDDRPFANPFYWAPFTLVGA